MIAGGKGEMELEDPMMDVVQTHIIPGEDTIDEDVFLVEKYLNFKIMSSSTLTVLSFSHFVEIHFKTSRP